MKSDLRYPVSLVFALMAGFAHAQPVSPTVTTLPASAVGATNATLNGVANPFGSPAFAGFEWGTTTNYGNTTAAQAIGSDSSSTNFSQTVVGLVGGVAYHFRAVASNSVSVARGANQSFTTRAFTDIGAGLPGVSESSVAWGDYDNDGRLDILLTGDASFGRICRVWRVHQH